MGCACRRPNARSCSNAASEGEGVTTIPLRDSVALDSCQHTLVAVVANSHPKRASASCWHRTM
eukprot:5878139-Prymnesium_polylepis.1